jgi:hypothetical protein
MREPGALVTWPKLLNIPSVRARGPRMPLLMLMLPVIGAPHCNW